MPVFATLLVSKIQNDLENGRNQRSFEDGRNQLYALRVLGLLKTTVVGHTAVPGDCKVHSDTRPKSQATGWLTIQSDFTLWDIAFPLHLNRLKNVWVRTTGGIVLQRTQTLDRDCHEGMVCFQTSPQYCLHSPDGRLRVCRAAVNFYSQCCIVESASFCRGSVWSWISFIGKHRAFLIGRYIMRNLGGRNFWWICGAIWSCY